MTISVQNENVEVHYCNKWALQFFVVEEIWNIKECTYAWKLGIL